MFDPRQAVSESVGAHLPAVPLQRLTPEGLRRHFAQLPAWAPELRTEPPLSARSPVAAAVLVPLLARPECVTVLLTQRASHLSAHAGQIAFPGGRVDADDTDVVGTALREAHEEIALAPGYVDVLAVLPPYTTATAYVVTPVVALVSSAATWQPHPGEVADVFEVPLSFLMNPAHHMLQTLEWEGRHRQWFAMPYHDGTVERYIWGATAGMLRNLYRCLSA